MKFRTLLHGAAAAALTAACTSTETSVAAEAPPEIVEPNEASITAGGAAMYPGKNIAGNAVNSADHTTLVAAVVAAGLTEPLSSPGPFTVFAPVNGAFAALPAGTVDTFLLPEKRTR